MRGSKKNHVGRVWCVVLLLWYPIYLSVLSVCDEVHIELCYTVQYELANQTPRQQLKKYNSDV